MTPQIRHLQSALDYRPSRRDWLRLAAAGVIPFSASGWLGAVAEQAAANPARKRACILLWMSGGPSQMDTFDLKPGHANGGPFKEIATNVSGIKISEHLPRLAKRFHEIALVRSVRGSEADHGLATFLNHTGYPARGPIQYPSLGSVVAKEAGVVDAALPNFVSIAPFRLFSPAAYGPGFLGPRYAPLLVGESTATIQRAAADKALQVPDLVPARELAKEHEAARLQLLQAMQSEFAAGRPDAAVQSQKTAYERAVRLMGAAGVKALSLDAEPSRLRDAYGRNIFGQGCLLARRLVEHGVPFVEVTLGGPGGAGWDTHVNNFDSVKELSAVLDAAWSGLLVDLKEHGLLERTLVVWMGEFGRTPRINGNNGRDHYPYAWTAAFAGGGIKGGQVVGKTSADGSTIEERPVAVPDLLATVYQSLGIDPALENISNTSRPIRLLEKTARPIGELIA